MAAEFNLVVKLNPSDVAKGTKEVEGHLRRTKNAALELNSTLRGIFGFYAIKEAIMAVGGLANSYVELQNKLRVVTTTQTNLNTISRETFSIAQATRSSWTATATMYQRLALAGRDLGASQKQILGFTKSLNQAVVISGATSMEAHAGLIQLSQGMASGTLRGDELRSVLEQLPVVADVIAKHFGVTRGQLRQLGRDGKITGQEIIAAFHEMAPELEKQFGKTLPTLTQAWEMVTNAATKFFGEVSSAEGILPGFTAALVYIAEHFDTFGKILIAVGQIIAVYLAQQAIGKLIAGLRMLALAAVANPFTALLYAILAIVIALRQFGDQIYTQTQIWTNVKGVYVSIGDVLRALWIQIKELGSTILEFVSDAWSALTGAFSEGVDSTGMEFSLHDALRMVASFVGSVTGLFHVLGETGKEIFGGLAMSIAEQLINAFNIVMQKFGELLDYFRKGTFDILNHTFEKQQRARTAANLELQIFRMANGGGTTGADNKLLFAAAKEADAAGSTTYTGNNKYSDQALDLYKKKLLAISESIETNAYAREGLNAKGNDDRVGKTSVPHLDNPLKGATTLTKELLTDALDTMDAYAQRAIAKVDADARDIAKKRYLERPRDSFEPGGKADDVVDPKAAKELAKLEKQLDALLKKSNDVTKAEIALDYAEDFLGKAQVLKILEERGLTAASVMQDVRESLHDALDPLDAYLTKTIELTAAMTGSNEQEQLATELLKIRNDLEAKSGTLKDYELIQLERVIKLSQERERLWKAEQKVLQEIQGPLNDYHRTMKAIAELKALGEENGGISDQEAFNAKRRAMAAYAKSEQPYNEFHLNRTKAPGEHLGMETLKSLQDSVGSDSQAFAAAAVASWNEIGKAIKDAAQTGKVEWETFGLAIMDMLTDLAIKILEIALLKAIVGIASPAPAATAFSSTGFAPGVEDAFKGVGWGGAHATGGSYTAGGSGGPDSQAVMFHMTPGERADFTPRGQKSMAETEGGRGAGRGRATVVHLSDDRRALLRTMDSSAGDDILINAVRRNPRAFKDITSKG